MNIMHERLREERLRLKMSQEAFGAAGGVGKLTQLKYEKGERRPDARYLERIAAIGANVDYVLTGSTRKLRNRFSAITAANEMARLAAKGTEEFRRLQTQFFEMLVQSYDLEDEEEALLASYRACAPEDKAQIQKLAARLAPEKKTKKPLT